MEASNQEEGEKKYTATEVKTFPIPFTLKEIKSNSSFTTKTSSKPSKEQIINQAFKFHSQGNLLEAAKYYQSFIDQGFKDHRVFSNYGIVSKGLGKPQQAVKYYRKAIKLKPDFADAHSNLGNILRDLGKLEKAELAMRRAIQINPAFADAHYNLGTILADLGKLKEAEFSTRQAIKLSSDHAKAKAYSHLGGILRELGELEEAELLTRRAIQINPDFAIAYSNLGTILRDLGKLEEAELAMRRAIQINPDFADAHYNLGNALRDLGKLKAAKISYIKTIQIKPDYADSYFDLSLIELQEGNYQSGLENYEFRFMKKKPAITHGKPKSKRINNKKFNKGEKLIVVSEQGLGDTLQYMRYIPYLRNQGFDISVCAQEKLHTLIKSSGVDPKPLSPAQTNNISKGQWIPLLSLPRYLQVNPNNPIISEPYIFSTDELRKKWKNILSNEKRPIIGINWQGNPKIEKNNLKGRSLPLETFSTVAKNNNLKFLSLQKGFGSEQLDDCSFKNKFVESQPQINSTWDFLENAAIIDNCDLIITSDTSIAHLAGGMGKTTWLLLHHLPEWRWGLERKSTFWYPTMTLFRQKEKRNWREVMERVSDTLKLETGVK